MPHLSERLTETDTSFFVSIEHLCKNVHFEQGSTSLTHKTRLYEGDPIRTQNA